MMVDPVRRCPILAKDGPLARRIKSVIAASCFNNIRAAEIAAGLPLQALTVFQNKPLRLSPERRRLVMESLERLVDLPVSEIAALAGILPSGEVAGANAPRGIEGLSDRQATAANAFHALVGRRPWPGLMPDRPTWATWPDPLRHAWQALRAADSPFAAAHPRAQLPSFAVWRIVIEGDRPGWSRPDGDEDLAALERQALAAGLDALADLLVPVTDGQSAHPCPEPVALPETGEPKTPAFPPFSQNRENGSPELGNQSHLPDLGVGFPQCGGNGVAVSTIPQSPKPATGSRPNGRESCSPVWASNDSNGLFPKLEETCPPVLGSKTADLHCHFGNADLSGDFDHAAPRPPQAKARKGRPSKESALSLRVRSAMAARGISSVADLEHRAGLPVDGWREIMRGKVGRNKSSKLATVERVAAILRIPVAELAQLAGLIETERKTDRGTPEIQLRREALAAGGDARVCWSALGVLLAHGEVEGRLGISQSQHDTGRKFADLIARSLPGAPKMPRSELERFAYPGGRREADIDTMELRTDAARLAWRALVAADREVKRGIKPSLIVWDIAVRDRLPRWAEPAAFGPWSVAALAEWEALRWGLKVLRRHFGQDAGHRAIVTALIERDEARG